MRSAVAVDLVTIESDQYKRTIIINYQFLLVRMDGYYAKAVDTSLAKLSPMKVLGSQQCNGHPPILRLVDVMSAKICDLPKVS